MGLVFVEGQVISSFIMVASLDGNLHVFDIHAR
jgi:hypothetical protein